MTRPLTTLLLVLAFNATVGSQTDGVSPLHGFFRGFATGSVFLDEPEASQHVYVQGVVDGMFLAPFFGASDTNGLRALRQCMEGMDGRQLAEMLRGHLERHPESWHRSAAPSLVFALDEHCPAH